MNAAETRAEILARLKQDLVGPIAPNEVLSNRRPLDTYLTGVLWPLETPNGAEDDDGEALEDMDHPGAAPVSVFGQMKPSTMGISFGLEKGPSSFRVSYSFGAYKLTEEKDEDGGTKELWSRQEIVGVKEISIGQDQNDYLDIDTEIEGLVAKIHVRSKLTTELRMVTVSLINTSRSDDSKKDGNSKSLFQTMLMITTASDSKFVGLPDSKVPYDEDEESAKLLYSEEKSFAVGHQCSATWSATDNEIKEIRTEWIPVENVLMFSQSGHEVFYPLISNNKLSAKTIAVQGQNETLAMVDELIGAYEKWIEIQLNKTISLASELQPIASKHIQYCNEVKKRMATGRELLAKNENAFEAFRISNAAMAIQHIWKLEPSDSHADLSWRPFQLAFLLLTIESVINPKSEDREILDLLWFPTGGGKTEAYLAIIALGAVYQRLVNENPNFEPGNFAVMRYTLRLLTAQQFERASALILALEIIRKKKSSFKFDSSLGKTPFSIGLWVGGDATPNNYGDAKENRGSDFKATAEQLRKCFKCDSRITWNYNDKMKEVRPQCTNQDCELGPDFGLWPIATVDEDIYKLLPTLLIGTVDKFAQLPRRKELRRLFGFRSSQATQLIIQDELHLISGPLGTIVGAYEMAIDWLMSWKGSRPKVIGSTATIRRANSQVRALFDRRSCQFPPSGLSYKDSGFAVVDESRPGRLYVGLSNAGRSAKFTLQAVAGSLLQSGGIEELGEMKDRDGYTTLLMYFNNLRELGGAIVQILDDVPDSILLYSNLRNENCRIINDHRELTSTRTQSEIVEILEDLKKSYESKENVDVVLATNMVSVGVDVPRLGLMQVNGQPKTRSEYIQATSRVGRADYPGLVIVVHNILRARDRSHFETYATWHRRLYRDVEATSVTPFASRSRDRTLKALVTSMVRHGDPNMLEKPNLDNATPEVIKEIVDEIYRRAQAVSPEVADDVRNEVGDLFDEWDQRDLSEYFDESPGGFKKSLLQSAENAARKMAAGGLPGFAWPVMNSMRSVEPDTPFRLKERKYRAPANKSGGDEGTSEISVSDSKPWR